MVGGDFDIDIDIIDIDIDLYWYSVGGDIRVSFIFIIPSRNFLFLKYSISRRTNKYILLNTFTDLSGLSFDIHEIEFAQ